MRVVIRYYETGAAVQHLAGFENGYPVWTTELGEAADYSDDAHKARATLRACLAHHGREEIVLVRIRRTSRLLIEQAKNADDAYRSGFADGVKWTTRGLRTIAQGLTRKAVKAEQRADRMRPRETPPISVDGGPK